MEGIAFDVILLESKEGSLGGVGGVLGLVFCFVFIGIGSEEGNWVFRFGLYLVFFRGFGMCFLVSWVSGFILG